MEYAFPETGRVMSVYVIDSGVNFLLLRRSILVILLDCWPLKSTNARLVLEALKSFR